MDRTTPLGSGSGIAGNSPNVNAKIEGATRSAHDTTDKLANQGMAEVDRLRGSAHRAVNSAGDAASSAASLASNVSNQAKQMQTQVTDAATNAIRAQPITIVAGALLIGYMLGRL